MLQAIEFISSQNQMGEIQEGSFCRLVLVSAEGPPLPPLVQMVELYF